MEFQSLESWGRAAMFGVPMTTTPTAPQRITTRVVALRRLSETGWELTLERGGIEFRAGQLVHIHGRAEHDGRSYTICSGERDEHVQVVFRLIPEGVLTPQLVALRAGASVEIAGPYGEFTIRDPARQMFFVATGTGIAPARSYVRSHAGLKLTVLHGVRVGEDLFYRDEFAGCAYHPCVSGEGSLTLTAMGEIFRGRVTGRAAQLELPAEAHYYLCGANEMFYDMRDLLAGRGVPPGNIFTEAYYYRGDD